MSEAEALSMAVGLSESDSKASAVVSQALKKLDEMIGLHRSTKAKAKKVKKASINKPNSISHS
jgi:hypothetical protein